MLQLPTQLQIQLPISLLLEVSSLTLLLGTLHLQLEEPQTQLQMGELIFSINQQPIQLQVSHQQLVNLQQLVSLPPIFLLKEELLEQGEQEGQEEQEQGHLAIYSIKEELSLQLQQQVQELLPQEQFHLSQWTTLKVFFLIFSIILEVNSNCE